MVSVNHEFCEMSGFPHAECVGRNCRFIQRPDTDPNTVTMMRDTLGTKRGVHVVLTNYRGGRRGR